MLAAGFISATTMRTGPDIAIIPHRRPRTYNVALYMKSSSATPHKRQSKNVIKVKLPILEDNINGVVKYVNHMVAPPCKCDII